MNSVPLILDITGKDNNQSFWLLWSVKDGYACELLSIQGCKVAINGFNVRLTESILIDEVGGADQAPVSNFVGVSAGFQSQRYTAEMFRKGEGEGGLQHHFAAGEGDTAAGSKEDIPIPEDPCRRGFRGEKFAADPPAAGRADPGASAALTA